MRLYVASRLYDGSGGPPRARGAVRVGEDGRIVEVGVDLAPRGDEVIRLEGTLLPGLIDCHVHLCLSGGPDPRTELLESEPAAVRELAREALARHLAAGVTTVRDLGGVHGIAVELGREVDEGALPGPRVIAAGRLVCALGGHGVFIGREASGPEGVGAAVREEIDAGARCVKVVATGGMMTPGVEPGAQQMTRKEMESAVSVAREAGLRVAAHAQGASGIKDALRAGVHTIEHGIWIDDDALALFAEHRAALVPTFNAPIGILAGRGRGVPDFVVDKMERAAGDHETSFRAAAAAEVAIAAGTDAGTPLNPHGSLAAEVLAMAERGLPGDRALFACTGGAADALGLDDAGRLEPGRRADLVLVDGDPLAGLEALGAVRRVYRDGRLVIEARAE